MERDPELADAQRELAALFRDVAETLRKELRLRGWSDEQIDAELRKRQPRRRMIWHTR